MMKSYNTVLAWSSCAWHKENCFLSFWSDILLWKRDWHNWFTLLFCLVCTSTTCTHFHRVMMHQTIPCNRLFIIEHAREPLCLNCHWYCYSIVLSCCLYWYLRLVSLLLLEDMFSIRHQSVQSAIFVRKVKKLTVLLVFNPVTFK